MLTVSFRPLRLVEDVQLSSLSLRLDIISDNRDILEVQCSINLVLPVSVTIVVDIP